jgi:hypothetical protein
LTLGGGLSYLSAQYGLACDNVDEFEVRGWWKPRCNNA